MTQPTSCTYQPLSGHSTVTVTKTKRKVVRQLVVLKKYTLPERSEHAGDAALDFSAFQGLLADADVVEGFDALAPGVDLGLIEVAGGGGVREEQRQRQSLIHVLGGLGVRVDDGLPADLVGVLVVTEVVGHVGGRVVHAPDLAFLANLDLGEAIG